MDAKELRGVADQLAKLIVENKSVEGIAYGLARVLSYLESEQEKRKDLADKLANHAQLMERFETQLWGDKADMEARPGLAHEINMIKVQSKRNGKLLMSVLAVVLSGVVMEALRLVFAHAKP